MGSGSSSAAGSICGSVYLVSGEPLARGGSGTQGKISDTAKRKQLVVGFIVIMVIGTFGGDIVVILVTDRYGYV
jgi:hypothetical protein